MLESVALKAALSWYIDHGVNEALADVPRILSAGAPVLPLISEILETPAPSAPLDLMMGTATKDEPTAVAPAPLASTTALVKEASQRAAQAQTLEELKSTLQTFDGLAIKKTATQIVFADGNPKARVMLVGEAPGADEDRLGRPFVGVSGQLLDKIVACIGLSRTGETPEDSLYISNILNWRPPGNRTPTDAEMAISRPFIERHIALIQPKVIILCGGISAKTLLGRADSISRLRGSWHSVLGIPARATYHPSYLLRTPSQKRAVWEDMLEIKQFLHNLD
ncbi:MAG: uracil-DNA glycosylase [Alphaproteobacteria bacterium]|nr:uracil-DNA glycosylase [Alphaproteobacteria bacterium]